MKIPPHPFNIIGLKPQCSCPWYVAIVLAILATAATSPAAVTLTSTTDNWTAIAPANIYDPSGDYSAQNSADIVGTFDDPGFFTLFDETDDHLAFRVRMNGQNGDKNFFGGDLWVGVDADGDGGIDAYLNYSDDKDGFAVEIYGTGTDLNVSPNTTSVTSTGNPDYVFSSTLYSNYGNYSSVESIDGSGVNLDAGGDGDNDWYVSFQLPFDMLVQYLAVEEGINITKTSPLSFIVFTSTQPNSFNQDIGGVDDSTFGVGNRWDSGPLSNPLNPVPEPDVSMLIGLCGLLLLLRRRKR